MAAKKSDKPTVADLLSERIRPRGVELTAEQLEQVKEALAHNDREPNPQKRLSSKVVTEFLRAHYGFQYERCTLERAACTALGRKSWAAK